MRSNIGFNLPGVRPTDRGCVFNDATCSADWFKTPDNKTPLPLAQVNAAGYPVGDFAWQVFYKCPPAAYNGVYTVEIDGTVTGIAGLSSPLKVAGLLTTNPGTPVARTTATITVNASKPGESASMTLRFTGVQNVTKIRIWRGAAPLDGQRRLHTTPIDLLKRANAGVLRGMEFTRTNSGRLVVNPSDLTSVNAPTYCYAGPDKGQETGCPPEFLYDACNEVGADCWDCVTIDATFETAAKRFAIARDRLRPDVFYRVEFHNELWNNRFAFKRGHDLAQQRGRELAAAGVPGFKGIADLNVLGWRYNACRSVQLVSLARDVFGPNERHRVRGTLAGQAWDNRPLDEARKYLREVGVTPSDYFDGYAMTHYFGESATEPTDATGKVSVDAYLAPGYTLDGVQHPGVFLEDSALEALSHRDADQFFQACAEDGMEPQGYETGTGFTSAVPGLVDAVLRDPRVKGVNVVAMAAWRAKGGGPWCKFVSWGDWGKSSYAATDDPTWQSPTLQAFEEYGPQWPYDARPVKPDPRDAEIARLKDELANARAATDSALAQVNLLGIRLNESQQQLASSRTDADAAKAERDKLGGKVDRIKAVVSE